MSKTEISAKDREDAEVLCLLRADATSRVGVVEVLAESRQSIGASRGASDLANLAWLACSWARDILDVADTELEAAALIRDGWCPGDPVVRLGR